MSAIDPASNPTNPQWFGVAGRVKPFPAQLASRCAPEPARQTVAVPASRSCFEICHRSNQKCDQSCCRATRWSIQSPIWSAGRCIFRKATKFKEQRRVRKPARSLVTSKTRLRCSLRARWLSTLFSDCTLRIATSQARSQRRQRRIWWLQKCRRSRPFRTLNREPQTSIPCQKSWFVFRRQYCRT